MQLVQEKARKYKENSYKPASVICRQFLMTIIIIILSQEFNIFRPPPLKDGVTAGAVLAMADEDVHLFVLNVFHR